VVLGCGAGTGWHPQLVAGWCRWQSRYSAETRGGIGLGGAEALLDSGQIRPSPPGM